MFRPGIFSFLVRISVSIVVVQVDTVLKGCQLYAPLELGLWSYSFLNRQPEILALA